jgi:hypothetical protein
MRRLAGGRVFSDYADEAWQASAFRLALIAVMAGSFAAGPAILRVGLGGPWSGYLIPVAMVVAVVGVFTTTLLGRPNWRDRRGSAFRLGEMLLIVFAVRVLVWVLVEGLPGIADVRSWFYEPGRFFTGEFAFATLVCLFVWSFAVAVTSDFLELAIQPDEVAARQSHEWGDSRSQWRVGQPIGRTELLERFALRWIGLGILFVVCAGMTRVDFSVGASGLVHVGLRGLGMRTEVVVCLVCYFLAGLLLMSQGRLAVLRGRWYNQEVEMREPLVRRWHVNSLVFVGLIALLALLLPLGSTSWLTGIVEFVIALLVRIVMLLAFLIGIFIAFLAALLSRLFGTSGPPQPPEGVAPPQVVPSQAEMAAQLPPWLGNAVLWTVVVLVAGLLLVNFLRTTGLAQGKLGKRLIELRLWWRARRARINVAVAARVSGLRRRLRHARRRVVRPQEGGASSRGPLLPRDQVRRYYLRAIKEASDEGVVRPPHKTPIEFAEDLRAGWPETEGDVRELTEAFVDARYSEHEIGDEEVSTAESAWRRLVRGLREARHRGGP